MKLTMYDCDFGVKIAGVSYDFEHVDSLTVEDPEKTRITRGANAKNKTGLVYKEGLKEPKRLIVPVLDLSSALFGVLKSAYKNQTRLEVYAIDRKTGSSKIGKNSILSNDPQQLTIDDSPESMQVSLEFETFDLEDKIKE